MIFGDPMKYAALFVRCRELSAAEAEPLERLRGDANPTMLAYIINKPLDLGSYKTDGIDFSATWTVRRPTTGASTRASRPRT